MKKNVYISFIFLFLTTAIYADIIFKTNQSTSKINYDDGDTKRGIDTSYTKKGNIITDNVTGLKWQANSSETKLIWDDALDYCSGLSIDGISGWRLPKISELLSLTDLSRTPTINVLFSNTKSDKHWSKTELVHDKDNYAFYMSFSDGATIGQDFSNGHKKSNLYYVKCVKGKDKRPVSRFTRDNTKEIVTDISRNLIWEDTAHTLKTMKLTDGINYCESLTLGGYKDWHLPNILELQSIADRNKYDPAINSIFKYYKTFGKINRPLHDYQEGGNYWSSSYYSRDGWYYYRTFDMQSGGNARCRSYMSFQIRCVRQGKINNIKDFDNDGIPDNKDNDDDNDGVLDVNDAFPLDKTETVDTDHDGIGNNRDRDDDNDGVLDVNDAFPLDSTRSTTNASKKWMIIMIDGIYVCFPY